MFPLKFSSACGTGTAWKVDLSSTLPVPQADCRRYLGQAFPLKKICLGHVPGSAPGTTAGTAGSLTVIWEPGFRLVFFVRVFVISCRSFMSLLSVFFVLESCHIVGLFVPLFSTFRFSFFMISPTIYVSSPSLAL